MTPPNPPHHSPSGLSGWGYQEGWCGSRKGEKTSSDLVSLSECLSDCHTPDVQVISSPPKSFQVYSWPFMSFQVLPSHFKSLQVLPSLSKFFQVLSRPLMSFQVLPIIPSPSNTFQVPPCTFISFQVFPKAWFSNTCWSKSVPAIL